MLAAYKRVITFPGTRNQVTHGTDCQSELLRPEMSTSGSCRTISPSHSPTPTTCLKTLAEGERKSNSRYMCPVSQITVPDPCGLHYGHGESIMQPLQSRNSESLEELRTHTDRSTYCTVFLELTQSSLATLQSKV